MLLIKARGWILELGWGEWRRELTRITDWVLDAVLSKSFHLLSHLFLTISIFIWALLFLFHRFDTEVRD